MCIRDRIIANLELKPLPNEGGFFRETYRSKERHGGKAAATAIYYLITPTSFSALHRLPTDEVWHFYQGDPVRQLRLYADGSSEEVVLGNDLSQRQQSQICVPAGAWQGTQLISGGHFQQE